MRENVKGLTIKLFGITMLVLVAIAILRPWGVTNAGEIIYEPVYNQTEARSMLEQINEFRKSENAWYWNDDDTTKTYCTDLQDLVYDYELEKVAMQRAAEIAINWDHTRPDGREPWTAYDDLGYDRYYTVAENIAAGQTSVDSAFESWREDDDDYDGQGHRRNMLNSDIKAIGIACVTVNGIKYWVQEFSGNTPSDTVTEAVDIALSTKVNVTDSDIIISAIVEEGVSVDVGSSIEIPPAKVYVKFNGAWPSGKTYLVNFPDVFNVADGQYVSISDGKIFGLKVGRGTVTGSLWTRTLSLSVVVGENANPDPTTPTPGPSQYWIVSQPQSKYVIPEESSANTYDVPYSVNFYPYKIEIIADGKVERTIGGTSGMSGKYSLYADPDNNESKIRIRKYRFYYNSTEYIETQEFTITKHYTYLQQPTSFKIDMDSTEVNGNASFETNFIPQKVELISNGIIMVTITPNKNIVSYSIKANIENYPNNIETKIFRAYYNDEDYIDSNIFTITKEYGFASQPESQIIPDQSLDNHCNVSMKVNFSPKKVVLLHGDKEYETTPTFMTSTISYTMIRADIGNDPDNIIPFKVQAFYDDSNYIESEEFTLVKTIVFLVQPTSQSLDVNSLDEYCNVYFELNYRTSRVGLISDNVLIKSYSGSSVSSSFDYAVNVDASNNPDEIPKKKFRIWYSGDQYVDSDEFTVTKEFAILSSGPEGDCKPYGTGDSINANYILNFKPKKIEYYENNICKYTIDKGLTNEVNKKIYAKNDNKYAYSDIPTNKFRFYFDENNYLESKNFKVIKHLEILVQPESQELSVETDQNMAEILIYLNFKPNLKDYGYLKGYEDVDRPNILIVSGDDAYCPAIPDFIEWSDEDYRYKLHFKVLADDISNPIPKVIWVYYGNKYYDYVSSDEFFITKDYRIINQPTNCEVISDGTDIGKVSYSVNYLPKKIELISEDTVIETITTNLSSSGYCEFVADIDNKTENVKEKKIRFYYAEDKYLESDTFFVTKHYSIKSDIADSYSTLGTGAEVSINLNFFPVKVDLIRNGETELVFTENLSNMGLYLIPLDDNNGVLRFWYSSNEYLESDSFYIIKEFPSLPLMHIAGEEATCFSIGNLEYYVYEKNDKVYYYLDDKGDIRVDEIPILPINPDNHSWGEPIYTWSEDNGSISAKMVCKNNPEHIETETVETISKTIKAATCAETGIVEFASIDFNNPAFSIQTKTVEVPALGHDWEEVTYSWSEDNDIVTAIRTCKNDPAHVQAEMVSVIESIEKTPTCEEDGIKKYTSDVFKNTAFSQQTKTEEIPALGHAWGKVTYTWNSDNSKVTAIRVCQNDSDHIEAEIVSTYEETEEPLCESVGIRRLLTESFNNPEFEVQSKSFEIPAKGHEWRSPSYTWSNDNSKVKATRICNNDESHIDIETVETVKNTKTKSDGTKYEEYVAIFTNEAFETQTKEVVITQVEVKLGDVDGDNQITPKDVTILRRHLAGGWNVDIIASNADVDKDGTISPKDVTLLRRYLAGGWGVTLS